MDDQNKQVQAGLQATRWMTRLADTWTPVAGNRSAGCILVELPDGLFSNLAGCPFQGPYSKASQLLRAFGGQEIPSSSPCNHLTVPPSPSPNPVARLEALHFHPWFTAFLTCELGLCNRPAASVGILCSIGLLSCLQSCSPHMWCRWSRGSSKLEQRLLD